MNKSMSLHNRRKIRNRKALKSKSSGQLRLSVFRSSKHIYSQIINDNEGVTIASADSLKTEEAQKVSKTDQAKLIGKQIAEAASKAGVTEVVFDRNGYLYHGRVKALAETARESGLKF